MAFKGNARASGEVGSPASGIGKSSLRRAEKGKAVRHKTAAKQGKSFELRLLGKIRARASGF